ncbi:hypothetical protein AXF42_Ash003833 [Apostasia shenzhenica]|uniref:Uncharacterized protein n=1 Tax=Apostasia shenzhenica TaxID=1088818 RepID=A0A2I0AI95_9ASPA|nr:hypothetical protein AXF42_Ash003833 [Apostasia shenzhenica]
MSDAYSATVGSGEHLSWLKMGKGSTDWRTRLHTAWSHILPSANSTTFKGESLIVSFLLGLKATVE